jgi:P27 family predicted phage terminase small subunit
MAGRYKESNVATLPSSVDDEKHHARHVSVADQLKPESLSCDERKVWDRIAPELSKQGRLKRHFVDFVAEYCVVKSRMDTFRSHLDSNGWSYTTTGRHGEQEKSLPQVAQLNDDWRKWNSLVAQLGLSPATELRFNDRQGSLFDDDFSGI